MKLPEKKWPNWIGTWRRQINIHNKIYQLGRHYISNSMNLIIPQCQILTLVSRVKAKSLVIFWSYRKKSEHIVGNWVRIVFEWGVADSFLKQQNQGLSINYVVKNRDFFDCHFSRRCLVKIVRNRGFFDSLSLLTT